MSTATLERETAAAAMPQKEKKSRFRRGFLIYLGVLIVLFAAALTLLWVAMARYQQRADDAAAQHAEKVRLAEAPQRAFQNFLDTSDTDDWVERYFAAHPECLDTRETVKTAMEQAFAKETLQCFKAEDWTAEAPRYALKAEDTRLAFVTLQGGAGDWTIESVELLLQGTQEASILVPDGCVVRCNGTVLADSYVTEQIPVLCDFSAFAEKLEFPVGGRIYTVHGLLTAPHFSLEAPDGLALTELSTSAAAVALPAAEAEEYQSAASDFVGKLVTYYLRGSNNTGGNLSVVLSSVVHGSQIYEVALQTQNGVSWAPAYTPTIESLDCGDVVVWSENCRSVDVRCLASGVLGAYTTDVDSTYRIYFLDTGDGFGICGLEER